ncbi:fimbrial protein [Klebsiella aerogenes]|uniref:fimbrial protein n=1 Tax=Klebsiella aerogenes TaxID=548 RepID=UPI001F408F6F|nr:fimbrial protein [Klebsiella aerogenes]
MYRNSNRNSSGCSWRKNSLHSLITGVFLSLLCLPAAAQADDDPVYVDGNSGELHVIGNLTESACRLDMTSVFQQVDLGQIATKDLLHPGDQGTPVPFHIRLKDCLRVQSNKYDSRTGGLVWSANQPVLAVAFIGVVDSDEPDLIRTSGPDVSGVGIRLMDEHYHLLPPGEWTHPEFLDPGQDTLTFYAVPERTSARLAAGAFHAAVDFHLNYE